MISRVDEVKCFVVYNRTLLVPSSSLCLTREGGLVMHASQQEYKWFFAA